MNTNNAKREPIDTLWRDTGYTPYKAAMNKDNMNHLTAAARSTEKRTKQLSLFLLMITVLFLIQTTVLVADAQAEPTQTNDEGFDHFTTGYPLIGKHQFIDCSSCHLGGQFKGTPLNCWLCHNDSRAPGKHPEHFQTSNICDDCHTEDSWLGARFDHSNVTGSCESCHNNIIAPGISPSHILTTQTCEDCHNTISFNHVSHVDHTAVIGTCSSCHNGSIATGMHPTHIATSEQCDVCHSTVSWSNASYDHSGITAACSSCHNGVTATGKHPSHIITTAECDVCHTTSTWLGAGFDHSNITGACSSCHDGTTATGKDASHFITTLDCDRCHATTAWLPMIPYSHDTPDYPGDHLSSVGCNDCHTTNSATISWPFSGYKPDCAGCHADDYDANEHKGPGDIPLPITEVLDCSGSCHLKDGIETNEHRTNSSEW